MKLDISVINYSRNSLDMIFRTVHKDSLYKCSVRGFYYPVKNIKWELVSPEKNESKIYYPDLNEDDFFIHSLEFKDIFVFSAWQEEILRLINDDKLYEFFGLIKGYTYKFKYCESRRFTIDI